MHLPRLSLFLAGLALACPASATPSLPVVAAASAQAPLPVKMSGDGQVLGDPTATGGAPFVAAGVSSGLGAWTNAGVLAIDPATGRATGSVTFTAADGDLLRGDFDGQFDPGTGRALATFRWSGGTGRFASASGTADFSVAQDPAGSFRFEASGSVEL